MLRKSIVTVLLFILLSTQGIAAKVKSSIVPLSGGGTVAANASVSISLSAVVPLVTYNVVCYIDTTYPFQYVLMGSSFTDTTSTIISYSLNGNYVMQDQLIPGHNIAVIVGKFTNPATGYIVFTNLDQTNPFNVNNCFAIPVQV